MIYANFIDLYHILFLVFRVSCHACWVEGDYDVRLRFGTVYTRRQIPTLKRNVLSPYLVLMGIQPACPFSKLFISQELSLENRDCMFLWEVGIYRRVYTASQPRGTRSSLSCVTSKSKARHFVAEFRRGNKCTTKLQGYSPSRIEIFLLLMLREWH